MDIAVIKDPEPENWFCQREVSLSHSIFSRFLRAAVLLNFLIPGAAQAQSDIFQEKSLKHNEQAARGCIARVDLKTAQQVMQRFNLTSEGATEAETRALGTALFWIEQLHAGEPHVKARGSALDPYAFKFTSGANSRQTVHNIVIGRAGEHKFGENVAQLVHELGHYIGNNKVGNNKGVYEEYFAATKGEYCKISGYSDDARNEQFAEAFAAFVTRPSMMKNNNSAGCRRAYRFFSEKFFENGQLAEKCLDGKVELSELTPVRAKPTQAPRVSTVGSQASTASTVSTAPTKAQVPSGEPAHIRPSELPPELESASEISRGI